MGRHILLADASTTIQTLVRLLVAGEHVELSFATTVQDAARAAIESSASLVLADLLLPGGGGVELARQLRDRVPVAVLVPPQTRLDPATAAAAGAIATLVKPFDRTSFLGLLRRTVGPAPRVDGARDVAALQPGTLDVHRPADPRSKDTTDGALDARIAAAVERAIAERLGEAVETATAERLGEAVERATAERLGEALDAALGDPLDARIAAAVERLVGERAEAIIRAELDRLLREEG